MTVVSQPFQSVLVWQMNATLGRCLPFRPVPALELLKALRRHSVCGFFKEHNYPKHGLM